MQAEHYNGLIAVWKEQGYTSHDVVVFKQTRRISGEMF